jgi:hypothetical protein
VIFVGDRIHLPQTHIFHLFIKIHKCILHHNGKNVLAKLLQNLTFNSKILQDRIIAYISYVITLQDCKGNFKIIS